MKQSKKAMAFSTIGKMVLMLLVIAVVGYVFLGPTDIFAGEIDNSLKGNTFDDGDQLKGLADRCPCEPGGALTSFKLNLAAVNQLGLFKPGTETLSADDHFKIQSYLENSGQSKLFLNYGANSLKSTEPSRDSFCFDPSGDTCTWKDFQRDYLVKIDGDDERVCFFSPSQCKIMQTHYNTTNQYLTALQTGDAVDLGTST